METALKERPATMVEREFLCVRNGIVYEVLNDHDVGAAIHCLTTTFLNGEPMTRNLGITPRMFQDLAEVICTKAAVEGMSVLAKDYDTGAMVGCLMSEDFEGEPLDPPDTVPSDFAPFLALLSNLDDNYKRTHPPLSNELLHTFMMGVYPEYQGRKIGYHLVEANNQLGRMKGFKATIAEVTGPISQRIFIDQHHYQIVDAIKYKDFRFQGKCCFEGISDCDSCQLVYKDLYAGIEKGWEHT